MEGDKGVVKFGKGGEKERTRALTPPLWGKQRGDTKDKVFQGTLLSLRKGLAAGDT